MDRFYQRHLPHEMPDGVPFFITWNLKGAMPGDAIEQLRGTGSVAPATGSAG